MVGVSGAIRIIGSYQERIRMGRFLSGACQDDQDDQENQSPDRLLAGSWQDDQDDQEHQNPVRRPPGSWHPNNLLMYISLYKLTLVSYFVYKDRL